MAWAIGVLLFALATSRGGVPLQPALRDYVHTSWTQHDGIPLSSIGDITQTTDGYLWITTSEEGLLRFDGVRFVPVPAPCDRPGTVSQAKSDGSGGLWLLCGYRIFHRDSSGRTVLVKQNVLPAELRPAMEFYVDRSGRLWLWGRRLGYLRADLSEGPEILGTERPSGATYCRFAEDSEGNLWFATEEGLLRIRDDKAERISGRKVNHALTPARAGGVYLLDEKSVLQIRAGAISAYMSFGKDVMPASGNVLCETSSGIWFGTRSRGVALLRAGRIETFARQEGLSSDSVRVLFEDREGTMWAGTPLGLHRFRAPLAYLMTLKDGLAGGMPHFVFHDRANGLWIGSSNRTVRIDRDSGRVQRMEAELNSIGQDQSGRIWAATGADLGYLQGTRFVAVKDTEGASIPQIFGLRQDADGVLWAISRTSRRYRIEDLRPKLVIAQEGMTTRFLISSRAGIWSGLRGGGVVRSLQGERVVFDANSGIAAGSVHAIVETTDAIWIGTDRGLSRWRNGKWTTWTSDHGLPSRGDVHVIVIEPGRLWLMTGGGILAVDQSQLDQTPDGQPRHLEYLRIGSLDRVMSHRGGLIHSPRVTRDRDGRLYFATVDSIAVVDPSRLNPGAFIPPIVLETVLVDRRPLPASAAPRFVKPDEVQFEYTSLSLRNPENVRFRYRLEGRDPDWVDAGTQRRATYAALRPGAYKFRVIGSGSEGVWNTTGAEYAFQIAAPFHETSLFLFAAAGTTLLLAFLLYRYRLSIAAERIRLRVEAQAGERLRIAQDMHDTFLQGMHASALTVHVAKEKLEKDPAESRKLLDRALEMVDRSTEEARRMLFSMRATSVSQDSIAARLESVAARETALYEHPPRVSIESSGRANDLRSRVDEDVCMIAAEALRNALRHARPRNIRIAIQFKPSEFQVSIADDGAGIDAEVLERGKTGHFGLRGMQERAERHAGVLKVQSRKGLGTEICLSLTARQAYL